MRFLASFAILAAVAPSLVRAEEAVPFAGVPVTLVTPTTPTTGQAGVTNIAVTASNVPTGAINPTQVIVTLTPQAGGTPVNTPALAVTAVVGATQRFTFRVPPTISVATPTNYLVTLAGQTIAGTQFQSSNAALLVINPPASILAFSPSFAARGAIATLNITGAYTNFSAISSRLNAGPGITVNSLSVASRTSLTAVVNIAPDADPGLRSVTVTTGNEVVTAANALNIIVQNPAIASLVPNSAAQGQTVDVLVTGNFTNFGPTTVPNFGQGISIVSITPTSGTQATVRVTVQPIAQIGPRTVQMTTSAFGQVATIVNGFSVVAGPAAVQSVNPNSGLQGASVSVAITGSATNWATGSTTASFGPGITVGNLTVNSPTSATAQINIDPAAAPGARNVVLSTGGEQAVLFNGLTVTAGSATISLVAPATAQQGQTLNVAVTGQFTSFQQGSTTVSFGTGVTVNSVTVNSPTSLTANVTVNPLATIGGRTLTVTTGSQIVTSNNFAVTAGPATLASINPASVPQAQASVNVVITGTATNFAQGQTQVFFGGDITVNGVNVTSPTSLTANITVGAAASVGQRTVSVQTGGEALTINFNVSPRPLVTAINPAAAVQGQSNVAVTITGQNAAFTNASVVSVGQGITVSNVLAVNANTLTAVLNIDAAAVPGGRTVTVTTGGIVATSLSPLFTVTAGTPILSVVNPTSAPQGQTLDVSLTGVFTTFVQGTTTATFGAGIVVNSVTVNSPTTAVANVTVSPIATVGLRTVTVTTNTQQASGNFSVAPSSPTFTISPSSGAQGQAVNVTLAGTGTNWTLATPTLSLGGDIVVSNFIATSNTAATATLTINPGAAVGPRTGTVTTGGETATSINGFNVIAGTPTISLAPTQAAQQATVSVTVTGQFTSFVNGVTTANFGSGITVNSVAVTSPTQATVNVSVAGTAALGVRNVSLTTNGQTVNSTFSVVAGPAILTAVTPPSALQGDTLNVTVTGSQTNFTAGITAFNFGFGITVNSVTVNSATSATVNLTLAGNATVGLRNVTATTAGETASIVNGFTVQPGTPVVSSLSPAAGQQGQTLNVNVLAVFTNFQQGITTANFGAGVTVNSVTVTSATSATVNLSISPVTTTGFRTVTMTTGTEVVLGVNQFVVNAGAFTLASLNPVQGTQGQTLNVAVTGLNTNFDGTTLVNFGAGITTNSVTVTNATSASANITISSAATPGPRTVTATTQGQSAAITNGFTVIAGTPAINIVSPNQGTQGQTLNVDLTAQFTNFVQGATVVDFGPGITVNTVTVNSPTTLTANITIGALAATGLRAVAANTGLENASRTNGFNVLPSAAALLSVLPNTGRQNETVTGVTVTGQNTNWANGTTVVTFSGTGVGATNLVVNSPTSLTFDAVIASNATLGLRNVTVSTGGETPTLNNAFTVQAGLPVIDTAAPNNARQAETLNVIVSGLFTSFVQGSTTASFGDGITVNSVTVTSPTTATVNITIAPNAVVGARTVTLTTGLQIASRVGAFTVLPGLPVILSVVPNVAGQGQSVLVSITGQFTNFTSGVTTVSFGSGVTAGTPTVNGPTSLTVLATVQAGTASGPRTVTVTTGIEVVSLSSGFTVQPGVPAITSISPNGGIRAQNLNVTLTGQFTNWNNSTTVSFGPGISVGGQTAGQPGPVSSASPTQITVALAIDAAAALGARDVTVTTGLEIVTVASGFNVSPTSPTAPTVIRYSPVSNATGVPINPIINVQFSAPIDRNSVNTNTFRLVDPNVGTPIPGTAAVDPAGRVITFTPSAVLAVNRLYQIQISPNQPLKDPFNNNVTFTASNFTTGLSTALAGPAIVTIAPLDSATNVPTNARVIVQFDKAINPLTQSGLSVTAAGTPVPGSWTFTNADTRAVFTPAANLAAGTQFTFTATNTVTDLAGIPLTNPTSTSFTTGATTDTSGITVVISPANGATGVPLNATIRAFFSKPIDPSTLTPDIFFLQDNNTGTRIGATISVDANRLAATLTPVEPLDPFTIHYTQACTVRDVADTGGCATISFTTGAGSDTTAPAVTQVAPAPSSTGVPINARVTVRFDKPLIPSTVTSANFTLTPFGGSPVPASVSYNAANNSITLTPSANLLASVLHTVSVSGVQSLAGLPISAPFTSTFTTGAVTLSCCGSVSSVTPANGATAQPVNTTVLLTFNRDINAASVTSNSVRLLATTSQAANNGVPVNFSFPAPNQVLLTPVNPLPVNATITVQAAFSSPVLDLAGNGTNFFQSTFTTVTGADDTPPSVISVSPADGATGVGRNSTVVLTFSEPVVSSTLNNDTLALFVGAARVGASIATGADGRTAFLSATLPAESDITVIATRDILDMAGNRLADFRSTFRTLVENPGGTVSVSTTRPSNGATGVEPNRSITVFFSRPLTVSSVTPLSFAVSQNGVLITGARTMGSNNQSVVFTPDAPFAAGASIQVFLASSIRDNRGNALSAFTFSFSVQANNAGVAPAIVSSSPPFFAFPGFLPANGVIDILFSKPLDPATVNSANVQLRATNNATVLPSNITLLNGNRTVRIAPSVALPDNGNPGNNYVYLFFSSGIRDTENIPFGGSNPYVYYNGNSDGVAPSVIAFAPVNGGVGVGVNALIRIDFNERLNRTSVTPGTLSVVAGGNPVSYSLQFSNDDSSLTVTPNVPLPGASAVTVTVNGVEDLAANPLAAPASVTFNTAARPDYLAPTLVRSSISSGQTGVPVNSVIVLEFNEPVDPRSVNSSTLYVYDNNFGQALPATLSLSSDLRTITIAPTSPFAIGRAHTIIYGATDLAGNSSNNLNFGFTTAFTPDTTGPQVLATNPVDNALDQPINSQVDILFDEPVQPTSLSSLILLRNGLPVPLSSRTLSQGNRLVSLVPMMPLPSSSNYSLTITEARDASGNLMSGTVTRTFATRAGADLIAPGAPAVAPANSATNVPTNVAVRLTFSEPLNPARFPFTSVSFTTSNTSRVVSFTRSLSSDRLSAVFTPTSPLEPGTLYFFSTSAFIDAAGNNSPGVSISFTTGSGPDTNAPVVTAVSPAYSASGVPLNTRVVLTYDRPLLPFSISNTSVQLTPAVAGTVSVSGSQLTFTPSAPLSASTNYAVATSGVVGLNGIAAAPFASSFTTGTLTYTGSGTVSNITPVNNASGVPVNSVITLTFNRDINLQSATNNSLRLFVSGASPSALAFNLSSPAANQLTLTPVAPLPANATIFVQVSFSQSVQDLAGNNIGFFQGQFSTANTPDGTAPTVLGVSPLNGAVNIGRNTPVVITFSESIAVFPDAQNAPVFSGNSPLGVTRTLSADGRSLTISTTWDAGAVITVFLNGLPDFQGNVLAPFQSSFTVASDLPASPAGVISTRPGNGALVASNTPVTAYFNRDIAPGSVNSSTVIATQNGAPISGTVALINGNRAITFTPSAPYAGGAFVQVFFTSGITDFSGLAISPLTFQMSVQADPATAALSIVSTSLPFFSFFNPPITSNRPVIEARFNRLLNPATVNSTNVQLRGTNNVTVIPSAITLVNGDTIRIVPTNPLPDNGGLGNNYVYLFYGSGITDTNGVAFAGSNPYIYYGTNTDAAAPVLSFIAPPSGAAGVGTNTTIRFGFDERLNPLSVNASTVVVTANGTPVTGTFAFSADVREVTFTPFAPLPGNASIAVTVNGVQDTSGNTASLVNANFTTGATPDFTAPVIQSTNYTNQAVPVNATLVATFDEAIDGSTVSGSLFDFSLGTVAGVTYTVSADGRTVTAIPPANLNPNRQYQYCPSVRDLVGNAASTCTNFTTTAGADNTAPTLVVTAPSNGLTGVSLNARITIQYNEVISGNIGNGVQLTAGGSPVAFTASVSNRTLVLTPSVPLAPNTTYTVNLTGIRDVVGNTAANQSFSFTTGATADTTPPTITTFSPAAGASNVPVNQPINVTFSEAIDPGSILNNTTATYVVLTATGVTVPVNYSFSADLRTVTLTPVAPLNAGAQYTIRAWSPTRDLAGNQVNTNPTASFTTAP
ncbi:MAG: Ig-like domain-containing protein [Bryobacteraceae bacterium]|nr:Ig-like domain-containing protein [Bryobacteraceae bacterium]